MRESLPRGLRELLDRQAISDCLNRYARGLDRKDLPMLRAAYHDDAVDHHGALGDYCVDGLIEGWLERDRSRVFSQHLILSSAVELDGDVAHGDTYFQVIIGLREDVSRESAALMLTGGRYVDRFERRNDRWGIQRRVVVVEYRAQLDQVTDQDGVLMWSRRSPEDPSYQRPLLGPPTD